MAAPVPRALALAAVALTAGLSVAGCSSAGHPGALAGSGSPAGSAAASPTHIAQYLPHTSPAVVRRRAPRSAPATRPAAPSPQPAGQPLANEAAPCPAASLRVGIGAANGAAGSIYYPLVFTNISGVSCTMFGYPGVYFAAGYGGARVGGQAVRDPVFTRQLVTLGAGGTAHASLQVAVAQNYPASVCKPVTARWLAVYPPASYVADYVSFTAQTCTGAIPGGSTLGIYVVRPGVTGP